MPDQVLRVNQVDIDTVDREETSLLEGVLLGERVPLVYRKSRALWGGAMWR